MSPATAAFDPALVALFASSDGPVTTPSKASLASQTAKNRSDHNALLSKKSSRSVGQAVRELRNGTAQQDPASETGGSSEAEISPDDAVGSDSDSGPEPNHVQPVSEEEERPDAERTRKRKRAQQMDDLEGAYFDRLAREQEKFAERSKRYKPDETSATQGDPAELSDGSASSGDVIVHETLSGDTAAATDADKASRTVFLGNVSTTAITSKSARKIFLRHLSTISAGEDADKGSLTIESLRFRSVAYDHTAGLPKRVSHATKALKQSTAPSANAYAVYSSASNARLAAANLNGTLVLNRHLRADLVSEPTPTDHRRCIFVGNLDYVADDSAIKAASNNNSDPSRPPKHSSTGSSVLADVEEGLWRTFATYGPVESVRVIRDRETRVGKGFAYVQFVDANAVEGALLADGKKFPPLLPRKLRVSRAKSVKRRAGIGGLSSVATQKGRDGKRGGSTNGAKRDSGRVGRRGGAGGKENTGMVFEGHRARADQGTSGLKLGRKAKTKTGGSRKKGDRNGRGVEKGRKRAAEWRAKGGNKSGGRGD